MGDIRQTFNTRSFSARALFQWLSGEHPFSAAGSDTFPAYARACSKHARLDKKDTQAVNRDSGDATRHHRQSERQQAALNVNWTKPHRKDVKADVRPR
jgi:hypothetical protein